MTTTKTSNTLLIIVHYKSGEPLLALLESLKKVRKLDSVDVLVVDNCSGEKHLASIRPVVARFSNIELLEFSENKGYFGAANGALAHYLSQRALPRWVIVSNSDVLFNDEQFFEKLAKYKVDAIGVLAPRISVSSHGMEQNPFMIHPLGPWRRFTMRFYSAWYPLGWFWDWVSRQKRSVLKAIFPSGRQALGVRQPIYAAHGSFLIFSNIYFAAGGFLDDSLFLFGEEIAVAETCRKLELKILYEPDLRVLHDEHSSIGQGMSRTAYQYHRKSVRHLFSKYLQSY